MMITDQAEALRALSREKVRRGARVIAVGSGKGGVGKSNLVVNLAIRLTELGRKVVVLDADLGAANIDVLCNVQPVANIAHVVAGRRTLEQAMITAPGGFQLIPGASGLGQIARLAEFERDNLIRQMQGLEDDYDVVLIDTGAGISPNVLSFACGADELLVVATPEPTAITDAYALIKVVCRDRPDARLHLVVNMVAHAQEARGVYERINQVCDRFLGVELQDAGYVLMDPSIRDCVRRRQPAALCNPEGDASRCISRLAMLLERKSLKRRPQNLLSRMSMWLAG